MKRDLISSLLAIVVFTLVLGIAYPLVVTGASQAVFPSKANGSQIKHDGKVVGSSLLAQDFKGARYFKPRPSQTDYNPAGTFFSNFAPNQKDTRDFYVKQLATYLKRERRYDPGLTVAKVPVDAVTTSASGVDPDISQANARIQARRVAAVRGLSAARLARLIDDHTDGRSLGVLGEPGVNVTTLNLALDALR
jgi:K+-transporting ATPase ATPase C chain